MSEKPNRSARMDLIHEVIDELREQKAQPPFEPTADIDMVWILSAPGTIREVSDDGIYAGESADLVNIEAGIGIAKKITALRLGIDKADVTRDDIASYGPTVFYNDEDETTKNAKYPQNEHLQEAAQDPGFPIPPPKLIIDHIDELGTPAQIRGLAEFLKRSPMPGKIAVVSMIHHSRRVSRYLEHDKALFPEDVTFVNAPIPETANHVGKTLREVRKIADYAEKGDLSRDPYF